MFLLPGAAALMASLGWAGGIVLAQFPARAIGAFEFTRIQLVACAAILAAACTATGYWQSVTWSDWPVFAASTVFGILLGNLAMIGCLRRGGPRRTELLLSAKAPVVGIMAFFWLGEVPSGADMIGGIIALAGVCVAIAFGRHRVSARDEVHGSLWVVIALGIGAAAFQGFGFLALKPSLQAGLEPMAAAAIRLLGAAFLASLISLWPSRIFQRHDGMTPVLLMRTILPGFIGYGISSTLLLYAFAHLDAGAAAVLGSLSPVLVLFLLWFSEGTRPNGFSFLGAGLSLAGTAIISLA